MSQIVAIGGEGGLRGFAFAGVQVVSADDPEAARTAWRALSEDVGLVILTRAAYAAIPAEELDRRLWVVTPG
jgi:vacuolar-type H+-ATPase subunit F/Vma7